MLIEQAKDTHMTLNRSLHTQTHRTAPRTPHPPHPRLFLSSSPLAVGPPRCHVSAAGSRHRCWDWCCPSRPAAVQVWRRGALHRLTSKLSFQSTFPHPGSRPLRSPNRLLDWSCLASMSRALLSRHADFTRGCDTAEEAASRHPRPPSNPPASVLGGVEDDKGQHL